MTAGYRALREAVALIDLNARGRIVARGEDRARLLHAMSTNNIQALTPHQGCYAFFLSAQGRIVADADILCLPDFFLLDLEPETHDVLYQHLDKFIIADDVTLQDARETYRVMGVEGPGTEEMLAAAGWPVPVLPYSVVEHGDGFVARLNVTGAPGVRIFATEAEELRTALLGAGAVEASDDDVRVVRLENYKPRYGEDITERYLVQETQMLNAVHFSKGCYLGQEIVERVRSRGLVHRVLVPLRIASSEPVAKGTVLLAGADKAGEITSSAYSPSMEAVVAMGYLKRELAKAGTALRAGGYDAEVLAPCPLTHAR